MLAVPFREEFSIYARRLERILCLPRGVVILGGILRRRWVLCFAMFEAEVHHSRLRQRHDHQAGNDVQAVRYLAAILYFTGLERGEGFFL